MNRTLTPTPGSPSPLHSAEEERTLQQAGGGDIDARSQSQTRSQTATQTQSEAECVRSQPKFSLTFQKEDSGDSEVIGLSIQYFSDLGKNNWTQISGHFVRVKYTSIKHGYIVIS